MEQEVNALLAEGILDSQFTELMQMEDESNSFVQEVVTLYFEDSGSKMDAIARMLEPPTPNFNELDAVVHQFKGSCASLGAKAMTQLCIQLRAACQQQDRASAQALTSQMFQAYQVLRDRLQTLMANQRARTQS